MSILSGRSALAEIDEALRKARAAQTSIDTPFTAARTEFARLQQTEIGIFARLARLRLLAIEQGDVLPGLDDADRRAEQILGERSAAEAKLDEQIAAAEAALSADEQQRATQQTTVAAAGEAVDTAEAEAQARLAADESYRDQLARTEQADFVADQAEDKTLSAEQDRIEKGKPYEEDPLFTYLWSRAYGTSRYHAWPLTRLLDAKVAKLCGYEAARRNYALLTEIPVRLRAHATEMRARFDREVETLRALEQAAAEAAGVPRLRTALETAESDLESIDAALAEKEDDMRTLVEQRKRFAAGEDPYYQRCIDTLREALRQHSIQLLKERAARTLDREDDELVNRLAELEQGSERMERNLQQYQRLHELQTERLLKLEDVRRRFKAERFDEPRSEFADGALIAMVLNQFLTGTVGSGDVWDVIRRQHRHKRVHADPNFGTLRFPRGPKAGPWRMPKGGGLRGGGFRSGGGFKGGGFRSGGGF